MVLAAALALTGCEAYVTEHRRHPVRTYGYHGHRYYHHDYDRPYYGYRRYSYSRPTYYGYRRGYYSRPSSTIVVGRSGPYIRGEVRRYR